MYVLNSEDGGTMGELMDSIGDGTLKRDGSLIISKNYKLKGGVYVWEHKKARRGVTDKDLKQYIGLLVEHDAAPAVDELGIEVLNCVTSTRGGILSTLHSLKPYAKTANDDKPNWKIADIPANISYAMRDPTGAKPDIPLVPQRCSHDQDIVVFSPEGLVQVPKVTISLQPPMEADDRHVIFIHWSPSVPVKGNLMADEGYIIGASATVEGQYLANLKAHKGACGGGVFFKLDGTLAGIHQGIEHESDSKTGRITRKEIEALKEQKDSFTYFLGCDELSKFLNPN